MSGGKLDGCYGGFVRLIVFALCCACQVWDVIARKPKAEVMTMLEEKDEEAERLKTYIEGLMEIIIDKSPEVLEHVNKLNSKV